MYSAADGCPREAVSAADGSVSPALCLASGEIAIARVGAAGVGSQVDAGSGALDGAMHFRQPKGD